MAKTRKKKKPQQPSRASLIKVSLTFYAKYSLIARKVLQWLDLDPDLFDEFTKKEKIDMMRLRFNLPIVKAKPGHQIPRHYLKMVQKEINDFIKIYPVGEDEDLGLVYSDFFVYGLSFIGSVEHAAMGGSEKPHYDLFCLIKKRYDEVNEDYSTNVLNNFSAFVRYQMHAISKINLNIYGFEWEWVVSRVHVEMRIEVLISVATPRKVYFTYQEKVRPAYQAIQCQYMDEEVAPITIAYNQIIPDSERTHPLEVYVQNHALLRMKERIDVLPGSIRNMCLNNCLLDIHTRTLLNGQIVLEMNEKLTGLIGFLPFTIIGNKLYVLTFLPVCNQNTHEGQRLQQLLGISRKDIEFLGMDKLSFFIDNDFEQVPRLKKAIEDAGLAHLTQIQTLYDYKVHNQISTATLQRFFPEEYAYDEQLTEVEERA